MLSQDFIKQVKDAVDMVSLAKRYTELKLVGDNIWQGACPHPKHNDGTPSFTVWGKTQSWACMGCHSGKKGAKHKNYGSDCFAFLQWMEGVGWKQSILKLAEEVGIEPERDKFTEVYEHKLRLATSYYRNMPLPVYSYLEGRGLDRQDLDDWQIGFDGSRITFPLYDRYRKVLGFSKRKFIKKDKAAPKYRNSSNSDVFNKSSYLYGIHLLNDDCDEIRITEGAMDVVLPNKYGVQNIVATLGTSFTQHHVALIKNINKTPVFCMDGDEAGLKSIKKAVDLLSEAGVYAKVLLLPEGRDMADLANELREKTEDYIQDNSITYGQMMIQEVINQYDSKVNELKLKLYPTVKQVLQSIPNEDELKIIQDYVYEKMGLKL
ncbi:DNA primase [Bacillus atrophaeus]|uniref:DNA primase n=1 Tax=Bacillus atrophaeus TaxID=1452 RepID=UPI002E1CD5E8|nr:DNA primase [Bacillus atrophaeus]